LNVASDSALFTCSTLSIAEIPGLFSQRQIVLRHQKGALYYPFIEGLAHTLVDIPISFISVAVMSVIIYFLVGLQKTAGQFLCIIFIELP
jgi:ATP-binding cassette subfamily G (WHITE) protein 2 (SNQ2)